jgi:transcriptional regulator with XRE-family HTH domain
VAKRKRGRKAGTAVPARPIAVALRELRLSAGLTQSAVAANMGVTQRRVSAVESTPIAALELRTLMAFVAALGGSVSLVAELRSLPDGSASRTMLAIGPP